MNNKQLNNSEEERQSVEAITERVKYLIGVSRLSQGKFAQRISMDPANLSKVLSGNLKMSDSFLNRIVVELGVSKKWLLTGEGTPFEKTPDKDIDVIFSDSITLNPYKATGTPVYDIDATAGFQNLSVELTRDNIVGYMDYPKLEKGCAIIRASGDSMIPAIPDGALIAIRQVNPSGIISWGQIYVVVLEDYRLVKYVRKHTDPHKVLLHSANPEYDDLELDRNQIIGLYVVDAVIQCKFT